MKIALLHSVLVLTLLSSPAGAADAQADRAAFIARMQTIGVVASHGASGSIATLTVGDGFFDSDFDSKTHVAGVVYRYYHDLDAEVVSVRIIDSATGAEIGTFDGTSLHLN